MTDLLEKPKEKQTGSDEAIFAHYAEKAKVTEAYVMGNPIIAICGEVFIPSRDPEKLPICPACKSIMDALFIS